MPFSRGSFRCRDQTRVPYISFICRQVIYHYRHLGSPQDRVQSLSQEDPLEEEMATHSSILAWKIPWMEEPDSLQSMGSHGVEGVLMVEGV